MDFDKSLMDNIAGGTFVCAHRGVAGGNIPCNTMAAFNGALMQGAEIVELDVDFSRDGKYYIFHPGMENDHLHKRCNIRKMKSKAVEKLRFVNQDNTPTQFGVYTLEEVLLFLKGKCYINVDKFWTDIPGITAMIRKCGVEKQVIVKTGLEEKYLQQIQQYAPDFMFLPIVRKEDTITDDLVSRGVNCIGAEILFTDESDPVCSDAYIRAMHDKGRVLFANAIVYDYKDVLSAGHNDDISLQGHPEQGWGWLADKGFDIIQTDWPGMVKSYLAK